MSPRLVDVLRALPDGEFVALVSRVGASVDPKKRLDPPSQLARFLASLPELNDPGRLPVPSLALLRRIADDGGVVAVRAIPPAASHLLARGLVFARGAKGALELVLPIALLLALRPWDGEDPRGLRALLSQANQETQNAIASQYLGRSATPPLSLALEAAWEALADSSKLASELERLSAAERRVLEAVEREGGEVDTEELLELEREPMRLRTTSGAMPSRRGVGFSLERRGFLVHKHPNRHVVPTEVSRIVGAVQNRDREARRAQVRAFVLSSDHAPRRARFSMPVSPLALAIAVLAREPGHEIRGGVGMPRTFLAKTAQRTGRDPQATWLVATLARAFGLFDAAALSVHAGPGALSCGALERELFGLWRRGAAWDEARPDGEIARSPVDSREPSPAGVLRELLLETISELGDHSWIPWESLAGYIRSDARIPGVRRLLRRWADRVGAPAPDPADVVERIALESLPALGVVDVGEDEPGDEGDPPPRALRLTPRGRALVTGKPSTEAVTEETLTESSFDDGFVVKIGASAPIGEVLALAAVAELGRVEGDLELLLTPQVVARALANGFEPNDLKRRIEALCPLPEPLARTLAQASVVIGRGTYVQAAGFLWIEDPNVRELLRTRRATEELFVDPSPPSGLLIAAGIELERVSRKCRSLGVEIVFDGQVIRARSIAPPGSLRPGASGRPPSIRPGRTKT